ncbi:MAG: hypothetical protein ABSC95_30145 [Acetobacteraceae bacterium]|jgi:hypothetical protein
MSGTGIGAKLGNLADALLTLEVNTIVKAGMSAQKMPEMTVALSLVAQEYGRFLLDKRNGLSPTMKDGEATRALADSDVASGDQTAFERLRDAADAIMQAGPLAADDERGPILARIKSNGAQIARLLAGADPKKPTQELTILVHKAWDVGTELVIMQTSLQVDGDVITRLSPSMMSNDPDRFGPVDPGFISLVHNNALTTATAQWRSLFDLAAELLGTLGDRLFGPRTG